MRSNTFWDSIFRSQLLYTWYGTIEYVDGALKKDTLNSKRQLSTLETVESGAKYRVTIQVDSKLPKHKFFICMMPMY